MKMQLIVEKDAERASEAGAELFATLVQLNPRLKAVLATGNSPMGMYSRLAALQRAGSLDARGMTVFQLDAYLEVPDDDPRSLYGWMDRSFVQPLQIPQAQVVRFSEIIEDPHQECAAYKQKIAAAGGFDLAVLGLGPNGHLGFNEPPSDATATTRVVALTPESIESNAVYWGGRDRVPSLSLTVGIDALLASRKIILIALGAHKYDILHRTVEGSVSAGVPASFLQQAVDVTIIADEAAWKGQG
nr:glucosamine-6-phosphate deaminase [uncultured Rhizobium sp.]